MALILKWALIYYIALTCFSLHEDIANEQGIGPNHETADLSVDLKLLPPGAGPCHAAPVLELKLVKYFRCSITKASILKY